MGLIYDSEKLIDVLETSDNDILEEDMTRIDYHTVPHQLTAVQLAHVSNICAQVEAATLQKATALEDEHRREDARIRMKAASIEIIPPRSPTSL